MDFDILKYISWALTISIPFAGAWFFQYTKNDEKNGRKKITKFGFVAFILSIIGILLSGYLMIEGDKRSKTAKAEAKAETDREKEKAEEFRSQMNAEREKAETFRLSMDRLQTETNEKVKTILISLERLNANEISKDQFEQIAEDQFPEAFTGWNTFEELKRENPVIVERIISSNNYNEVEAIIIGELSKVIESKIKLKDPECSQLYEPMSGLQAYRSSFKSGTELLFSSLVLPESVDLKIADLRAYNRSEFDISKGKLSVQFSDGTVIVVECQAGIMDGSCDLNFSKSSANARLHSQLRKGLPTKLIHYIEGGSTNETLFTEDAAKKLRLIGLCTAR
ncbi:hypothetical protein [Roseibium sp. M-1]